jgi:oligopeptide transport system substrate-binding protein
VFRLRPDARWSDGSPVRSGDFVFAWQRLADPRAEPGPSPARTLLSGVAGYRPFAAGRARRIAGLTTPDPATLAVRLDAPFADLPALVAALPLSPLPSTRARSDPSGYLARPVGNGPFRLAGPARPGRPLTLERNPTYRGSPARLDRVSVHTVPDEQTAWLELQNGQVGFAPVPPDQLAAAGTVYGRSADGRTGPGLLQGPTLTTWQLAFNLRSKLARDSRWRQAFSLAVDRGRVGAALAGSAATSLVPPAMPGWGAGGGGSGGGAGAAATPCTACTHDPAKARSLFARAGGGQAPVTLAVPPGAEARRLAGLLADDLAAAGIDLTVTSAPTVQTPVSLVRRVAPYPRPDPLLTGSPSIGAQAERLLDRARATTDQAARTALYRRAEAAILAGLRAAPLLTEHHAAVLAAGPQGFDLTPWDALDLATVSLPA